MSHSVNYSVRYQDDLPDHVKEKDVSGVVCDIFATFAQRHYPATEGVLDKLFVLDSVEDFAKLSAVAAELMPVELETDDCSIFGHDEDGKYFRVLPIHHPMEYDALILPLSREITLQGADSAETENNFTTYVQHFNAGTALCGAFIENIKRIEFTLHYKWTLA